MNEQNTRSYRKQLLQWRDCVFKLFPTVQITIIIDFDLIIEHYDGRTSVPTGSDRQTDRVFFELPDQ